MKIKSIEFTLENLESIKIDGKYIGDIGINKIKDVIRRIAVNDVRLYKECSEFYIEIHKDANIPYKSFGKWEKIPFERLTAHKDICQIDIEFIDDSNQDIQITFTNSYFVKWKGESEYDNELQDAEIGDNGNLYLKIGKKKVDKYFLFGAMDSDRWNWNMME